MAGTLDSMKDPRLVCALHEVGHAVVATLTGHCVESMELFDAHASGLQARTRFAAHPNCPTAYADLATTLAGPIAESVFTGRDLLEVLQEGANYEASDLYRARREAQRLHRLGLYRSEDHALLIAEQRARAMLEDHWALLAKAAHVLYARGRLD
jgi:hypothetical protein